MQNKSWNGLAGRCWATDMYSSSWPHRPAQCTGIKEKNRYKDSAREGQGDTGVCGAAKGIAGSRWRAASRAVCGSWCCFLCVQAWFCRGDNIIRCADLCSRVPKQQGEIRNSRHPQSCFSSLIFLPHFNLCEALCSRPLSTNYSECIWEHPHPSPW